MKTAEKLIPQLRFSDYDNDWDKVVLENITSKISDGIHSTPKYDLNGDYYFVNGNNLVDGVITINENTKRVSLEEFKKHKRPLSKDSILLSINGTIGNLALYNNENIVLGKSACYINLQKDLPIDFYYYILQTPRIKKYFLSELTGSTIMNLSLKTIKATKLIIPPFPEQQKIASFLTDVDVKITKLTKKKTLLEQYKKGVMQKIFNQELRFKDDDGNNFADWEEKTLGEVATINMGQSPESSTYNSDGIGYYLIQGNADISNRKTSPRNWTSNPTKLCDIGDLILTVRAPVGAIAKSNHKACIGRGVCSIKNKTISNIEFIYQFLLDFEKRWVRLEQGSTFTAVSGKDIKSIEIKLPCIEEQTKIADFLSNIDVRLEALNTKIENSKTFKKGLLQKMFV